MTEQALAFSAVLLVASVLGVRATYRLTRRFRDVAPELDEHENLVLGSFVVVSWVITLVASVFGLLSVRRMLGFEPLTWVSSLTLLLSALVLLIPAGLDQVVSRVARVPWKRE